MSVTRETNTDRDDETTADAQTVPNDQLLATPSETQENKIQMQRIMDWTVRPGVIRLPVTAVISKDDSDKWVIDITHPFKGDIRFHFEKPVTNHDGYKINQILEWYGYGGNDPYHLQTERVCLAYDESEDDGEGFTSDAWEIVRPPEYEWTRRERLREWWRQQSSRVPGVSMPSVDLTAGTVVGLGIVFIAVATQLSFTLDSLFDLGSTATMVTLIAELLFTAASILTLAVLE